jgi:hypothetical protein
LSTVAGPTWGVASSTRGDCFPGGPGRPISNVLLCQFSIEFPLTCTRPSLSFSWAQNQTDIQYGHRLST